MNRLIVEARVLLAVIVPPALPSFGCVGAAAVLPDLMFLPKRIASSTGVLRLPGDRPNKARQFARDRGRHHRWRLACLGELAIPPAQPLLGLPRRVTDRLGERFLAQQLVTADPGREPIAPGGLDQHPPRRTVTRLGDAALAPRAAARVLGRHQA